MPWVQRVCSVCHLLVIDIVRRNVPVAFAYDGGILTPADGIHYPMGIVVVHDVEETQPAPWHSLYKTFPVVIESNCDLHFLIWLVLVTCTEQHHLNSDDIFRLYIYMIWVRVRIKIRILHT